MQLVLLGQLRLLLWKNWLMKKRHYFRTAFEIFIPLVLFFILWGIKDQVQPVQVTQGESAGGKISWHTKRLVYSLPTRRCRSHSLQGRTAHLPRFL